MMLPVLEEINTIRSHHGLEPVNELESGQIGIASCCPVANTIRRHMSTKALVTVSKDMIVIDDGLNDKLYKCPIHCSTFITEFDNGRFPDLIEQDDPSY